VKKRVPVANLRLGMYVEEFCGSWMDHPFWRGRFVIESEQDLQQIRSGRIQEAIIDASKGLDVGPTASAVIDPAPAAVTEAAPGAVAAVPAAPAAAFNARTGQRRCKAHQLEEFDRARKVLAESRRAVADIFAEARLGRIARTDQAEVVVENLNESVQRHPMALIGLARLKNADDYTYMHSVAVSALMLALAGTLGLDREQARRAGLVGLLHDVGKAQIPLEILNKPSALDAAEWTTMKSHVERSYHMLRDTQGLSEEMLAGIRHHHEKVDGSGYPGRLGGDAIPLLAKMCGACDVYDALTSNRPYKAGWKPAVAIRKMAEFTSHLDNSIYRAFVKTIGIYPVGSLVRLRSNRLAVVVDHDPELLLQPRVKVFFSLRSKLRIALTLLDLGEPHCMDRVVSVEDPVTHGLRNVDDIWAAPASVTA